MPDLISVMPVEFTPFVIALPITFVPVNAIVPSLVMPARLLSEIFTLFKSSSPAEMFATYPAFTIFRLLNDNLEPLLDILKPL